MKSKKNDREQILRVRDVFDSKKMNSLVVDENEAFSKTVERFNEQPQLRSIFIVDEKKKLKGVVTRTDLLNIVKVKMGKDLGEIPLRILALRSLREIRTRDIAGMFSQTACIKLDDPLERALKMMISIDLIAVPVVDGDNKIIGDLNLSEILSRLLRSSKE